MNSQKKQSIYLICEYPVTGIIKSEPNISGKHKIRPCYQSLSFELVD